MIVTNEPIIHVLKINGEEIQQVLPFKYHGTILEDNCTINKIYQSTNRTGNNEVRANRKFYSLVDWS